MENEIRALADRYAVELKRNIDKRVADMEQDDRSHILIYQVLGISKDEGKLIDVYQNKGRFLYKYAGSFLEEAAKLCFKAKFPASGSVRVPNTHGKKPKLFGVDCLVGSDALEIKWRDATTDGDHIIGATASSGGQLSDIAVTIPAGACPLKTPLQFPSSPTQASLATPNIGSINRVLISPDSGLAFVTFFPASTPGGNDTLPAYKIPCTTDQINGVNGQTCPAGQATAGSVVNVALTGQAGAPIAGTFSPDTNTFYVSTSGDDRVHFINTATLTDTQQINAGLTCGTTTTAAANPFLACTQGNAVPVMFLASRPRPSQGASTAKKN